MKTEEFLRPQRMKISPPTGGNTGPSLALRNNAQCSPRAPATLDCCKSLLICCLLLLVACQSSSTPQGMTVKVARVVSGQTLEVTGAGEQTALIEQVRLVGIEAPDLQQRPWGREAKNRLEAMIGSKTILLEFDVQDKDQFGRRLAYVWEDGMLLNAQMVAEGYVLAVPRSPNHKYDQRLKRAQEWARLMGQGIWNPDRPMRLTPTEFRHQNR